MMDPNSRTFPAVNPVPQISGSGFLHPNLLVGLNNMQFTTPHNLSSIVFPNLPPGQTMPSGQIPLNGYHHVSGPEFMEQLSKMAPVEISAKGESVNAGNTKVWVDTGSFVDSGIDSDNGKHVGNVIEGSKLVSPILQAKQTVSGEQVQQCEKSSRLHQLQTEQLSSISSMTSSLPMASPTPRTSSMGNTSMDEMSALKKQMEFLTKQLQYQQYMFSQQQNLWMFENASKMNQNSGAHQNFQAPPPSLVSHQQMVHHHPSQMSIYSNISNNSNGAQSKSNSTATTVVPYNACLLPSSLEASNHQTVMERRTLDNEVNRKLGSLHSMNVVGNSTEDEISSIEDEEEATRLSKHSNIALKTQLQQISPQTLKSEHNSQIESISSNMKSTYSKRNVAEKTCNSSLEHGEPRSSPQKDDTIENGDNMEQLNIEKCPITTELNEQQKFDETPIFGASEKTFEQLLAEKLKSEGSASAASLQLLEQPVVDNEKKATPVKEIKKQPFLRRGQGLQRYIPGDKRISTAPSSSSTKAASKIHPKPSSTSRLYEKNKQEEPLKVLGRSSTSDFRIPSPIISTPKQFKIAKTKSSPYSSENDLKSHVGLSQIERSPLNSNTTSSDNLTKNNLNSYLPNTNSFLVNVQKIEQEKGTANADLELFEMLEKAADTSGCSNVSMLLQYIANNPTASVAMNSLSPVEEVPSSVTHVFPATGSYQRKQQQEKSPGLSETRNIRSRPRSEESRKSSNRSSDDLNRRSRSSLNMSNSSCECSEGNLKPETQEDNCGVVKCRKVAKESSGQVDLGETSSTLTQGKLQPILFEDEAPFEDTRLSIETEKNVQSNGVKDDNEDPILDALMRDDTSVCVPKKTADASQSRSVHQSGKSSLSLTSDDNVSGSLPVPVRASTPPMRKVASKRSAANYQRALPFNDDDENLSDDELNKGRNRVEQSFDEDDTSDDGVVESKKASNEETRNQLVTKLFPALSEPKKQPSVDKPLLPLSCKGDVKGDKETKTVSDKQQTAASNGTVKNLPSVPVEAAAECSELSGVEMSSKLVEKLKHLDCEISRYRSENNAIAQLRKQREQELVNFRDEVANFEREKSEELKRIEKHSLEESAKLKKERKVFEEGQRVAREHLTKREREEVETLKSRIAELESQLKVKETRWKSATDRLKETVEAQKKEILELKTANQQLERLRIEQLKKQTRAASVNSSANNSLKKNAKPKTASLSSINHQLSEQHQATQNGHSSGSGLTANKAQTLPLKATKPNSNTNNNSKHIDPAAFKHQKQRSVPSKLLTSNRDKDTKELVNGAKKLDSPRIQMNGTYHVKTSSEVNHHGKNVRINDHVVELRHQSDGDYDDNDENVVDEMDLKMPSQNVVNQSSGGVSGLSRSKSALGSETSETSASSFKRGVAEHVVPVESRNGNADHPGSDFNVVEKKLSDGSLEYVFSNGTRKEVSADRKNVTIHFFNGDYKQTREDGSVLYYYSSTQTTQTKYPDGLEILEFDCGQLEKHFKDGTKEIYFPDKSVKFCHPNGLEETTLSDGTILRVHGSEKTIFYSNGQKEIHTDQYKKREYPDGTCKLQYPDGRQETRFASGRVRIKDAAGNVILDDHQHQTHNSSTPPAANVPSTKGQHTTTTTATVIHAHTLNGPIPKSLVI